MLLPWTAPFNQYSPHRSLSPQPRSLLPNWYQKLLEETFLLLPARGSGSPSRAASTLRSTDPPRGSPIPSDPVPLLTCASVPSDHSPGRGSASPQPPPAPAPRPNAPLPPLNATALPSCSRSRGAAPPPGGPRPAFAFPFPLLRRLLLLPRRSAPGLGNLGGWQPSGAEARRQDCQTRADCAPLSARRAGELQPQTAGGCCCCGRLPSCQPGAAGPAGGAPYAPAPPVAALNTGRGGLLSKQHTSWTLCMLPNLRSRSAYGNAQRYTLTLVCLVRGKKKKCKLN